MGTTKRMVCLANSWKKGGRCIAGKELSDKSGFLGWIRPVSSRAGKEVSPQERQFPSNIEPALGDIVELSVLDHVPHGHQTENYLLDSSIRWTKLGNLLWKQLDSALDAVPQALWLNGYSSTHGTNDRIPAVIASTLSSSLLFVQPESLSLLAKLDAPGSQKIRAKFRLNGVNYVLAVTDPIVADMYGPKQPGEYPVPNGRLCVSLGEPFGTHIDYCYKLAAAVLTP